MYKSLLKSLKAFQADQAGVTLVEYGIAIALAITLGGGTLVLLAGDIGASLGTVGGLMP